MDNIFYGYLKSVHPITELHRSYRIRHGMIPKRQDVQIWWLRKKSNFCVALHPSFLQSTKSTYHLSGFARLEFGAFYFSIEILLFRSLSNSICEKSFTEFPRIINVLLQYFYRFHVRIKIGSGLKKIMYIGTLDGLHGKH